MRAPGRWVAPVAVIALTGVAARLAIWLGSGTHGVQTWEYETIAQNLLAGRGFGIEYMGGWYRTFGSPPFAYLCAALYFVFGHHQIAVLLAQWLFSAVTTVGVYFIGRRLLTPGIGLLAAALVAFHPGLVFYDTHNLHPLSFDAALVVWSVIGLLALAERGSKGNSFACGLLHGLTLFERSSLVGLPVAALVWLGVAEWRRAWRAGICYLAGILLVLAPWLARSIRLYGAPVMTSTAWDVFWRGNNPYTDGGSFARGRQGVGAFGAAPAEFQRRILAADESGRQRIFAEAALDFIHTRPADALRLTWRKLWGFWWFMPQTGILYPHRYLVIYRVYYGTIAALGIVGVAGLLVSAAPAIRWLGITVLGVMASVSLVHAAFYVEIRHRWGIEPLILIFTAAGCRQLFGRARRPAEG